MEPRTIFDLFKDLINTKEVGEIITRTEYIKAYNTERGFEQVASSSMDSIRVYLSQLGYLEKQRRHGTFLIVKHVPEELDLRQALAELKRRAMGEPLKVQVGGTHYKDMKYQPIEFIAKLKMSFIQGCVVKYIARYKAKNGLADLQKALHYIEMAQPLGETRAINYHQLRELTLFIQENNISQIEGLIIKEALGCQWDKAEKYCKELIRVEYNLALD